MGCGVNASGRFPHPTDPTRGVGVAMATVTRCAVCRRPHLDTLPCWQGAYAARTTATLFELVGRVCWVCGRVATTADHITPRADGGTDALDNLRPACLACNSRRGRSDNPFTEDAPTDPTVATSRRWAP